MREMNSSVEVTLARGVSGAERAVEVKGSEEGRAETSVAGSRTLNMKSGSLFT